MKPQTYFRFALLFPYVLWVVLLLVSLALSSMEMTEALNMALIPVNFYVIGIILWFFPYTLLAIGLWVGSRNKSVPALRKLALTAPPLLFILMLIETTLGTLPVESTAKLSEELLSQSAVLGGFSLVFGYLCVGIALGIFKILQAKKYITEETPAQAG